MTPEQWHDEATRVLGARDGYAHALVTVRSQINAIVGPYSPDIHPRHVRKLAERERRLKPLRELEARFLQSHQECQEAHRRFAAAASAERGTS